ncbi:cardiolipin synthase [Phycisphaerales bacterium AB-hyl4]|uniref:Cardiolipin synthase n=1 Tax=Natronomicrosphaera hydrolytica TaxID=3242702 RepID=A0ABV4U9V4_9BACT
MTTILFWLPLVEWAIRVVMVVVILRRRMQPITSLAWLSVIFFLPIVGMLVYLMIGVSYLGRRRARDRRAVAGVGRLPEAMAEAESYATMAELMPEQRNMIVQAEQISGNPILRGNKVELIDANDTLIDALVADIDAAKHHVHIVFYIFWADTVGVRVCDALKRAAKRGVACRVLADAAGSRPLFRSAAASEMIDAGVELHPALPVTPWRRKLSRIDLRNHRKIAVVDGEVAYSGSHNIVEEEYGHKRAGAWVDLSGRFTGPIVTQFQMVFLEDWAFDVGQRLEGDDLFPPIASVGEVAAQVVPTGPSHEAETFRRVLIAALNAARHRIVLTTPYLVPDEPTMLALSMAASRGAEVSVIVPAKSDHPIVSAAGRWYFEQLLEAGIDLYQYHGGMLHAKTITVDETFALLGSANLDIRSFNLNFEINVLLYGPDITSELRCAQQRYLSRSTPVTLEGWRRRPWTKQYPEAAAALLSPLL